MCHIKEKEYVIEELFRILESNNSSDSLKDDFSFCSFLFSFLFILSFCILLFALRQCSSIYILISYKKKG